MNYLTLNIKEIARDKKIIIRDSSLDLPNHGLFILKGENGSGKTTLLTVLSGINYEYNGEMFLNGQKITDRNIDDYKDDYAQYVPQDALIYPDETVLENLTMIKKDKNKAIKMLTALGLEKVLYSKACTLSSGEKQRVALARAFFVDKPILLLDEPTANLDENNQILIYKNLIEEAKNHLIIFATHENLSLEQNSNSSQIQIADKSISIIDRSSVDSPFPSKSTILKNSNLKEELLRPINKEKGFSIILCVIFFMISLLSMLFFSIGNSSNSNQIKNLITSVYRNTSPSLLIDSDKAEDLSSIKNKHVIQQLQSERINNDLNSYGAGSYVSGLVEFIEQDKQDFSITLGTYPSNENEAIVSDLVFPFIKNKVALKNKISEAKAEEMLLSKEISLPIFSSLNLKLSGVYKAKSYENLDTRYKYINENDYLSQERISYAYGVETVFSNTKLASTSLIIIPNDEDSKEVKDELLYQNLFVVKSSTIALGKDNTNHISALSSYQNLKIQYLILAFQLFFAIFLPFIFFLKNRKYYLMLRIGGVKKSRLLNYPSTSFSLLALISSLLGQLIGIVSLMIFNVYINSIYYNASIVFINQSLWPWLIIPTVSIIFFISIFSFLSYAMSKKASLKLEKITKER